LLETIETYLAAGIIGLVIGVYITNLYNRKKIRETTLAKIIEVGLVENKLKELESQIRVLNNAISSIKGIGESLEEQMMNSQDIEKTYINQFEIKDKGEIKDLEESKIF